MARSAKPNRMERHHLDRRPLPRLPDGPASVQKLEAADPSWGLPSRPELPDANVVDWHAHGRMGGWGQPRTVAVSR